MIVYVVHESPYVLHRSFMQIPTSEIRIVNPAKRVDQSSYLATLIVFMQSGTTFDISDVPLDQAALLFDDLTNVHVDGLDVTWTRDDGSREVGQPQSPSWRRTEGRPPPRGAWS